MGASARKAGRSYGASETSLNVSGFKLRERIEPVGVTPASYARDNDLSYSAASTKLFRMWRDGSAVRERRRHPDYGGRAGFVYILK